MFHNGIIQGGTYKTISQQLMRFHKLDAKRKLFYWIWKLQFWKVSKVRHKSVLIFSVHLLMLVPYKRLSFYVRVKIFLCELSKKIFVFKGYYSFFTSRCSTSKTLTRLKSWRIKIFCFWPQEKLDTNNLVNGFVFDVLMMNFPISCWKFDIFKNPVKLLSKRTLFVQK